MQLYLPPRNRSFGSLDVLGLVGLVGLLVARFVPIAKLIPWWGCTWRKVTGWPCPGCGLTRAADRFSHLNLVGAFEANPLGTVAAFAFAVCVVASAIHLVFAVPMPELILSEKEWKRVRWGAGLLFAVNYCVVAYFHRVMHFS